jgi:NitT/TauT family transport system substrate-binding protein
VLLVTVVLGFSGCARRNAASTQSSPGEKALVRFDVPMSPTAFVDLVVVIAKEEGLYEKWGLDVQFVPLNASSNVESVSAVLSEKVTMSLSQGVAAPLILIDEKNDISIIGGIMTNGGGIVTLPQNASLWQEDSFYTQANLTGKKIGVRRASSQDLAFRAYLAQKGIDISKINFVELDTHVNSIEAVVKGELDAADVATTYRTIAQERGLIVAKQVDTLSGDFPCCRIVTSGKQVKDRRADFIAFLAGNIEAFKIYKNNEERSIEIALKYFDIQEKYLRQELYGGHLDLHPDPGTKIITDLYKGMLAIGYSDGTVENVLAHIDTSLYQEALAKVAAENPNDAFYLEMQNYFKANN